MNPVTKQLLVTPSPHLKAADTTQRIMFQVLVGLMPGEVPTPPEPEPTPTVEELQAFVDGIKETP